MASNVTRLLSSFPSLAAKAMLASRAALVAKISQRPTRLELRAHLKEGELGLAAWERENGPLSDAERSAGYAEARELLARNRSLNQSS